MNVLVACEESQRVCTAFREKGHNAFSCDILSCSGGYPEFHIQGDVLPLLNGHCGWYSQAGLYNYLDAKWDLIIAHPPCTYLTVTGNKWFKPEFAERFPDRQKQRNEAIYFFMAIANADCDSIAIENPVGVISSVWRKPDQIIHPWFFGDSFEKRTCLWLKGLPPLVPTDIVSVPPRKKFDSGKSMPSWYADIGSLPKEERAILRSKTFPGFAKAMADQWG